MDHSPHHLSQKMGKTGFWILIFVHLLGVFAVSAILYSLNRETSFSFFAGGLITAVNFYTLAVVLKAFAGEKSVAWAISLVVCKYAIFGYFIYYLVKQEKIDLISFVLGVGSLAVTAPLAAVVILKLAKGKHGTL